MFLWSPVYTQQGSRMAVYFSVRPRIDSGLFLCHGDYSPEVGDEAFDFFLLDMVRKRSVPCIQGKASSDRQTAPHPVQRRPRPSSCAGEAPPVTFRILRSEPRSSALRRTFCPPGYGRPGPRRYKGRSLLRASGRFPAPASAFFSLRRP